MECMYAAILTNTVSVFMTEFLNIKSFKYSHNAHGTWLIFLCND